MLAKVLAKYPWDTGSVWALKPIEGELAIVRIEDSQSPRNTQTTGILESNCRQCNAALKVTQIGMASFTHCPNCEPQGDSRLQSFASLVKEANRTDPEDEATIETGIPHQSNLSEDQLQGVYIPKIAAWVEAGWNDFSPEGVQTRVVNAQKYGELDSTTAASMLADKDLVVTLAGECSRQLRASRPDLFDGEGLSGEASLEPVHKEVLVGPLVDKFNARLAQLKQAKPKGMDWGSFMRIRASLKEAAV